MHFSVLVIDNEGKRSVQNHLAPFQENNMGDCPEEFMEFEDIEDELMEEFESGSMDMLVSDDGSLKAFWMGSQEERLRLEKKSVPNIEAFESFEAFVEASEGMDARDEGKGRYGRWGNPNARWDWYEVGGRYKNMLINKKGQECDSAFLSDIDFNAMWEAQKLYAEKMWDKAQSENEEGNTNKAQYLEGVYGIKPGMTKEEYIADSQQFVTFAVLLDGEWLEKEMNSNNDGYDNEKWLADMRALISGLPPTARLTVVDCHI